MTRQASKYQYKSNSAHQGIRHSTVMTPVDLPPSCDAHGAVLTTHVSTVASVTKYLVGKFIQKEMYV